MSANTCVFLCTSWFPLTLSLYQISLLVGHSDSIQCRPILAYPCVLLDVPWHSFSIRYHSWSATQIVFSVSQFLCIHVYKLMSPDTFSLSDITPGRPHWYYSVSAYTSVSICTSWCPLTLFLYQISLLVGHPDIIQCRHILVYPYVRVNVPCHSFSIRYHTWSATLLVFGVVQYYCIHEYELIFPDTLSLSDITPGRPPDSIQCWPILVYPCVRVYVPWHTFFIRYHSW